MRPSMNKFLAIFSLLTATSAFAAPFTIQNDSMIFGRPNSSNKVMQFNLNLGASNPIIRANGGTGKLQFANDGVTFNDFAVAQSIPNPGPEINFLVSTDNPDFEQGTTGWTASGGTFTTVGSGSQLYGTLSGAFTGAAIGHTLSSAFKPISGNPGLASQNCLGAISYIYGGSNGDYSIQIYDGTSVLAEVLLNAAATATDAFIGFVCPASGSIRLRIASKVIAPSTITVDGASINAGQVLLGQNILLTKIAGSSFVGSVNWIQAAGCRWSVTNPGFSFTSFAPVAACVTPVGANLQGMAVAPATKIPAIQLNNLPAGKYRVEAVGAFQQNSAGQSCFFGFYDGSTQAAEMNSVYSSAGNNNVPLISGTFNYTTTGSHQIELRVAANAPNVCEEVSDSAGNVGGNFTINVYRYSQLVY